MTYMYIALGAVAGAPLRYFLQERVRDVAGMAFPWGTLLVNVSGCLAIGFLLGIAEERNLLSFEARLFLVVGFLGSYTTFSTFGWDTLALLRDHELLRAGANIVLSNAVGVFAAWAGLALARSG